MYIKARGHSLEPHVDDRFLSDSIVCNLSMGCDAVMEYTKEKRRKSDPPNSTVPIQVRLPRRSLQIMQGSWRYDYRHGIPNANLLGEKRVSVTFRRSILT